MMRTGFVIALLLLATASAAIAGGIKDGTLSAYSNGTNIVVRWMSESELDVRGFQVERRAGVDGPFILLTTPFIPAKGDGTTYEFVDNAAYRINDNLYQYRVTAVGNGSTYYVTVNHRVSSVRRTWGSIKAMFR
ncbi:MAG: hypothetical protein IT282_12425 [Bacteroidetes bacterium]|nr:hypothetical protein [Bacteroidota bacterium]